jgi:hypothetical protein
MINKLLKLTSTLITVSSLAFSSAFAEDVINPATKEKVVKAEKKAEKKVKKAGKETKKETKKAAKKTKKSAKKASDKANDKVQSM